MSHRSSHKESLPRSFCSTVPSSEPPIVRYTAVSSANKRTWDEHASGRSFIYTRNCIGPKTEPWGDPEVTEWLGPSLTLRPQGLSSVTGHPGRPGSRIVTHSELFDQFRESDSDSRNWPRSSKWIVTLHHTELFRRPMCRWYRVIWQTWADQKTALLVHLANNDASFCC